MPDKNSSVLPDRATSEPVSPDSKNDKGVERIDVEREEENSLVKSSVAGFPSGATEAVIKKLMWNQSTIEASRKFREWWLLWKFVL